MSGAPVIVENLEEFYQQVDAIVSDLSSLTVILLVGQLGVGKSEFVKAMIKSLGSKDESQSPSFAIINQYQTQKGSVDHVDLYRLKDDEDLESTGFWDLFAKDEGYIVIEWADRLEESLLPPHWNSTKVHIKDLGGEKRSLMIS